MKTKRCFRCGETKTLNQYYKATGRLMGVRSYCKKCESEYDKTPRRRALKRISDKKYRQKPEVRAKNRLRNAEYRKRPEVKERIRLYSREYRKTPKSIEQKRKYARSLRGKSKVLLRKFGITFNQYNAMLERQGKCCAICGKSREKTKEKFIKDFAVDHDHETGKVRGLLCLSCNVGLGSFKDNPKFLRSALRYLIFLKRETMRSHENLK